MRDGGGDKGAADERPPSESGREHDAAERRKIEPDQEDSEYDMRWDDSWWPDVNLSGEDKDCITDYYTFQARRFRDSWEGFYLGAFL
ncbi:hypothetical protein ACP70R_011565 [Stipagrostis hirtigluma subsp. patula]